MANKKVKVADTTSTLPSDPADRIEIYLDNIAGGSSAKPTEPHTHLERYLDYIADNPIGTVTQQTGQSTTAVMSQKAVTDELSSLNSNYAGVDLTVKFATEIANYSDEWAWITARETANNFLGIHPKDYMPVTANGTTYKACILGIDTYKNYGDTAVGTHIDWIFEELWVTRHAINKVNYNNGISTQQHPWLASDAYYWANSLAGSVPNETTADPATVAVDYTADGIYYYLPQKLKNVIIEKRMLLPKRYSASGVLSNPNSWGWANIGKIWFPTECEVYGQGVWGVNGYEMGGSAVQYPYFAGNMNRVKYRNGSRDTWWLLSVYSGNTTNWCLVNNAGDASNYSASYTNVAAPVCFRT